MDQPSEPRGIFGLKSPGRTLAIVVVLSAFGIVLLLAWATGAMSCESFEACPWFRR